LVVATRSGIFVIEKSGTAKQAPGWLGKSWDYPSAATGSAQGVFYFGSPGGIHAINSDGTERWFNRAGAILAGENGSGSTYGTAPALDRNGNLYVASNDGMIRALRASDGKVIWAQRAALESGEGYNYSQVLGGTGNAVFVSLGGTAIAAYRTTDGLHLGRLRQPSGGNVSARTPFWALGYGGVIFDGLSIFDRCGTSKEVSPVGPGHFITAGTIDPQGRYVAVTMDMARTSLVTPNSARIALFDSKDKAVVGPTAGKGQPVAIGADGAIYTVDCRYAAPVQNRLYAYDAHLSESWHLDLGAPGKCQSGHVVLDRDGVLYMALPADRASGGTDILAIQTASPGLSAASAWPMPRHDNWGTMWLSES
jgi:outer membrane protein assembly factor BamB